MRYFCQADIENRPYPRSLFRKYTQEGITYEEKWDFGNNKWNSTSYLTRLIVGGDCSLIEITKESAELLKSKFK